MKLRFFIVCLLIYCSGLAQREAGIWYFGNNAGLDFNSGVPQVLLNGQIKTVEGCESFSDSDGNLLFYTEGNNVWNRFHEIMTNGTGLDGSFSTSQSALAIPNPLNNGLYYVFTPDDVLRYRLDAPNGFNYSVIDMRVDGGRGDVVQKNVDLLDRASENVSAVLGDTGDYYWVVTHYQNKFYSYRVDGSGVNTSAVVTTVGPVISDSENYRGSMKIAPNGSKIAIAHTVTQPEYRSSLYLFDFNNATGQVSNPINISGNNLYYGVEFSSNSKVLYASGRPIIEIDGELRLVGVEIDQFDLQSPNISSSRYLLAAIPAPITAEIAGSLQLAIDKKIYHSIPNARLSVIRTPNLTGFDADIRIFEVDLGGSTATYGLPPFIQSLFETLVEIENFCEGDTTVFTIEPNSQIQSIFWDFGDPASGTNNTSTELNPTHIFTAAGVYTVNLEVTYDNGFKRDFVEFVEIAEIPDVITEVRLLQCDTDGTEDGISQFNLDEAVQLFNNGNPDIRGVYFLSLDDAIQNINQLDPLGYQNQFNGQRIYARAFENSECFSIIEIILEVVPVSDLGNYDTMEICDVQSLGLANRLDLGQIRDSLKDDFGDEVNIELYISKENALLEQDPIVEEDYLFGFLDDTAFYFRVESNNNCTALGRLELIFNFKPDLEEKAVLELCNGQASLEAVGGFEQYKWSTGESVPSITVHTAGVYTVTFLSGICEYQQQFTVEENKSLILEDIVVSDFSKNNRIEIYTSKLSPEVLYSIDNGNNFQGSPIFTNLNPGIYEIRITDNCTELTDLVIVGGINTFFTPNNDGRNDYWTLSNSEYFPKFRVSIFDRYGALLNTFDDQEAGWDGTSRNRPMPSDDYWFSLVFETGRTIKGHFSLKR